LQCIQSCRRLQETAGEKAVLFAEAAEKLMAAGEAPNTTALAYFVPGRVEVGNYR
jgi:hypothetical protein